MRIELPSMGMNFETLVVWFVSDHRCHLELVPVLSDSVHKNESQFSHEKLDIYDFEYMNLSILFK